MKHNIIVNKLNKFTFYVRLICKHVLVYLIVIYNIENIFNSSIFYSMVGILKHSVECTKTYIDYKNHKKKLSIL
jgi:hypothetical protein